MKILQINLRKSEAAHDLLSRMMLKHDIDIALVSEINLSIAKGSRWITNEKQRVAIKVAKGIFVHRRSVGDGYSLVETQNQILISCYFLPGNNTAELKTGLAEIAHIIQTTRKQVIIGGDFNAKSPMWGGNFLDSKGRLIEEWALSHGLVSLNDGLTPTYHKNNYGSYIDVTFVNDIALKKNPSWRVMKEDSLSDHRYILIETATKLQVTPKPTHAWNFNKDRDAEKIELALQTEIAAKKPTNAIQLADCVERACKATLTKRRSDNRKEVYWWNKKISELHKACQSKRRKLMRANQRSNGKADSSYIIEYREARQQLRIAISKSKSDSWEMLCKDVDNSPWGDGYKIAMKKVGKCQPLLPLELTKSIISELFPVHPKANYMQEAEDRISEFTLDELRAASLRLKSGKAAGVDGIPPDVVKILVNVCPVDVLRVMNNHLKNGDFPREWKTARLVLLKKSGRPDSEPSGYRPICLLNCVGKLMEQLLNFRLTTELDNLGGLSHSQYGFRKGRSTTDAVIEVTRHCDRMRASKKQKIVAMVTVDVKNAFNSASWQEIVNRLAKIGISWSLRRMIQSYLSDRWLEYNSLTGGDKFAVNSGVPQGSVLGPTLWNVLYEGVLRTVIPLNCRLVAYADDLAVLATAEKSSELTASMNRALRNVADTLDSLGLSLAPDKCEAVIFAGRRKIDKCAFSVQGKHIETKKAIKYLGVWLDHQLNFNKNIEELAKKAVTAVNCLVRLMGNKGGPSSAKRRLLSSVITSILLYAAPVWAGKLNKTRTESLERPQRLIALRIIAGYRTVSKDAALAIASLTPISLLAKARRVKYLREAGGQDCLDEWQDRWNRYTKGKWTQELIPDIREWQERQHGELDHWVTQFLTGHGGFGSYLFKTGLRNSDQCDVCAETDTPLHALFHCRRHITERRSLDAPTWPSSGRDVVVKMLECSAAWKLVQDVARKVLEARRQEDKEESGNVRAIRQEDEVGGI